MKINTNNSNTLGICNFTFFLIQLYHGLHTNNEYNWPFYPSKLAFFKFVKWKGWIFSQPLKQNASIIILADFNTDQA